MPVNYQELRPQMKEAGKTLRLRHDAFSRAAEQYETLLRGEAGSSDLRRRVEAALMEKPDTRCALPKDEAIDAVHSPAAPAAGADSAAGL